MPRKKAKNDDGWISIEDKCPKNNDPVLVKTGEDFEMEAQYYTAVDVWLTYPSRITVNPVSWMPLQEFESDPEPEPEPEPVLTLIPEEIAPEESTLTVREE